MLVYTLTLGPSEKQLAQQAYRSGEPIPDRIQNAPQLFSGLGLYYDAFFDLDTTRNHQMQFSRISWLSIREYGEAHDFNAQQLAFLLYCIPRMDQALREFLDKKLKANGNASGTGEGTSDDSE